MVIDTSALLAVLLKEQEAPFFARALESESQLRLSVVTYLEATIVIEARKPRTGRGGLETLVREAGIQIVPFDGGQMFYACQAWRDFGKGRHPAALNMGDCATYALVRSFGDHLLCKGDDFNKTDIAHRIWKFSE